MAEAAKRLVLLYHGAKEGRGGWFDLTHRAAVAHMTAEPHYVMLEVETAKLNQINPDMPAGKLKADGKPEPLPVMLTATFEQLMKMVEAGQAQKPFAASGTSAAPGVPLPWSELRVGSIVLASEEKDDGWWEAVVVAIEDTGKTLRLRWRDFQDHEHFSRAITRVGLVSPTGLR